MATTPIPIDIETIKAKRLANRLRRAVERRIEIAETARQGEREVKGWTDEKGEHAGLNDTILDCFAEQGCDGVRFGDLGYMVQLIAVEGRETLDRDALMAELLRRLSPSEAAECVAAATKKGSPRSEVRLTKIRGA